MNSTAFPPRPSRTCSSLKGSQSLCVCSSSPRWRRYSPPDCSADAAPRARMTLTTATGHSPEAPSRKSKCQTRSSTKGRPGRSANSAGDDVIGGCDTGNATASGSTVTAKCPSCPPCPPRVASPEELYQLYLQDRLIIHSIPIPKLPDQPSCFQDATSLMCGTLLFAGGLAHKATGQRTPNGVARFGDKDRIRSTVFASLHDLAAVWEDHACLEAAKAPERRNPGGPFLYFAHHDMADQANACGGQPPESYMDCKPDGPGPTCLLRTRSFDFRRYCEEQPLPHQPPEAESYGVQWNEIRAALSYNNLVGLAYIHEPGTDPRAHLGRAEELRAMVEGKLRERNQQQQQQQQGKQWQQQQQQQEGEEGEGQGACRAAGTLGAAREQGGGMVGADVGQEVPRRLQVYVFLLSQKDGVNGDLLVQQGAGQGEGGGTEAGQEERDVRVGVREDQQVGRVGRAVTLEEFVKMV